MEISTVTSCGKGHKAGVPNLFMTMYPFSIPTDEHVPLQHFDRLTCSLKFLTTKYFILIKS